MPGFPTKHRFAYEQIKESILTGSLRPGDRLNTRILAERLGISEIPVREAIKQLEAEGLVVVVPHVGATVTAFSATDVLELYQILAILEPSVTALSVPHFSEAALQRLVEVGKTMDAAMAAGDVEAYGRLNREFHFTIYSACPNRRLQALVHQLWEHAARYRAVFKLVSGHAEQSHREHHEIIGAILRGDAREAEQAMARHRRHVMESLLELARTDAAQLASVPEVGASGDQPHLETRRVSAKT